MFTNISAAWLIIAVMIAMIIMASIKLFSRIHPFHFLEHKATSIDLLFMSIITIHKAIIVTYIMFIITLALHQCMIIVRSPLQMAIMKGVMDTRA
jgi:hypothetical protein